MIYLYVTLIVLAVNACSLAVVMLVAKRALRKSFGPMLAMTTKPKPPVRVPDAAL